MSVSVDGEHNDVQFLRALVKVYLQSAVEESDMHKKSAKLDKVLKFIDAKGSAYPTDARLNMLRSQVLHALAPLKQEHSLQFYESSLKSYQSSLGMCSDEYASAKVHLRIAIVADEMIRSQQQQKGVIDANLASTVVSNVLRAMRLGSKEARLHFPRILDISGQVEKAAVIFKKEIDLVPAWMTLKWVPQLISVLDKKAGECSSIVLTRLADAYPQALYYPLRTVQGDVHSKYYQDLIRRVSSKSLDEFIAAMQLLSFPEMQFKDAIKKLVPNAKPIGEHIVQGLVNDAQPFIGKYRIQKPQPSDL